MTEAPQPPVSQPQQPAQPQANGKDWLVTLLLALLLGNIGVHRFYVGKMGTGILMLLTGGACGIWTIVDIIMIATGSFTDIDGNALVKK